MNALNTRYFQHSFNEVQFPEARSALNNISRASMAVGAALVFLGIVALTETFTATVVSVYLLGLLLLGGAISLGVRAFSERRWTSALGDMVASILYLMAGLVAFREPILAATGFTLVIAALFMAQGIMRIIAAVTLAPPQWGWVLANGIVTLALGLMVYAQWPASSLWLIGTLIGIDMILGGSTALVAGISLSQNTKPRSENRSNSRRVA
ncbi:MAG: HdeD family acid-resistance protein [Bdellovibrionota bacterium]